MTDDQTPPRLFVPEAHVEFIKATKEDERTQWIDAVWKNFRGKCAGCGSDNNVAVKMIVPEEAGGKLVVENGTIICRTCEVARSAVEKAREAGETPRRPVNVWVSRKLYDSIHEALDTKNGFTSMGSMARYMMGLLVETPSRFEDLQNWQDRGSEVKINLWLDQSAYESFKEVVADRNMTVTDGIKGLMLMYTEEGAPSKRRS